MRSDEYHRLGAACAGMAKSTHSDEKSRWLKLARECSTLANETAEKRTTPCRAVDLSFTRHPAGGRERPLGRHG